MERPPLPVRVVRALLALFGVVSLVGAFLFAFPSGTTLGPALGTLFVLAGLALLALAWRLPRGERGAWGAALAVVVLHEAAHRTVNLVEEGRIPPEDYPFMGFVALIVVLLLLPTTRRFFRESDGARQSRISRHRGA